MAGSSGFAGARNEGRVYFYLALATAACLLPFSGRAFNIDDTLFLRAAQQISQHPLDPYRFSIVWYWNAMPMWEVTKNPPLASYYIAAIARLAGWSERALHIGFLLPAIAVVLGTYRLARRFTRHSRLAAVATLLAPAFLVSACSVMSDVLMLAFWMWAAILWIEGLKRESSLYLISAGLLIGAAEVTKYAGVFLIGLLFVHAFMSKRRLGTWVFYLLIPLAILGGYEYWTHALYGQGLFLSAQRYAREQRQAVHFTKIGSTLVALSFAGGGMVPSLSFAPWLWSRRQILAGAGLTAAFAAIIAAGLTKVSTSHAHAHWAAFCLQMTLWMAGGISVLALAAADWWKTRDHDSVFLGLWVFGIFCFTAFLNYVANARSILLLIPAAAILMARRLEIRQTRVNLQTLALGLAVAGVITFWVTWGDADFANAQRSAAISLRQYRQAGTVWFEGRRGFEYYMEAGGCKAFDVQTSELRPGDLLVLPNLQDTIIPPHRYSVVESIPFAVPAHVATQDWDLGAGFYSARQGPLPFAFGSVVYDFHVLKVEE